jgi:galactose mutarotase-like enzyme
MVELRAGGLAATWLPEHGMVGMSLRHEGGELLGQRGGLDAYLVNGSAFGVPLLAPWANRLDGLRYGSVDLDPAHVKGGNEGLPKDGAMAGRPWAVEDATATSVTVRFDAGCAGYGDVLAVFPFPHAWRVVVTLTSTTRTQRPRASPCASAHHGRRAPRGTDRRDWWCPDGVATILTGAAHPFMAVLTAATFGAGVAQFS